MLVETAFKTYQKPMERHIASFCGDEATAMDAVSQAFTQAWVRKDMVEAMPDPAQKAWLYATARNAAIDMKRKTGRLGQMPEHDLPDEEQSGLSERINDRFTVEELVKKLPVELSIPVHMKYWQGMNATEIGKAMSIPPATVRTRIRTALGIMRKEYNG